VIAIKSVKQITREQADELYRRLPKPDKYIFAIGMETGLRISDILRLRNRDVENPLRAWVGRVNAVMSFKLSDWLYNELANYTAYSISDYLFGSPYHWRRSMHRVTFHRHIKQALVGLDWDCSAHSIRKFYLIQRLSD